MLGYNFVIYADGGVGKTTLATTGPGRKLLIDIEERTDNLTGEVVHWNGKAAFPECGPEAIVVIPCKSGIEFDKIVSALGSGKIPVQTVIVDSVTMMQLNEIDNRFDGMPKNQQEWGQVLKTFAPAMQRLMQISKGSTSSISCVVLVAWHREAGQFPDIRITPDIVGQLNRRLSHLTDVVGYLTVRRTGQKKARQLQIEPSGNITAKCAYSALDKYNGFIQNPNLTTLIKEMENSNG